MIGDTFPGYARESVPDHGSQAYGRSRLDVEVGIGQRGGQSARRRVDDPDAEPPQQAADPGSASVLVLGEFGDDPHR